MTVEQLAARCAEIGATHLTEAALYAVESGRKDKATGRRRRTISVDEWVVLAQALEVDPIALLVPPHLADGDPFPLTSEFSTTAGAARRWLKSEGPLDEWARSGPLGPTAVVGADTDVGALLQLVLEDPDRVAALSALLGQVINQPKGGDDGDQEDHAG